MEHSTHPIDPEFAGYPLRELAAAALQRASELGAEHADFRAELIRGQHISLSDGHLETLLDTDELGLAVRVVRNGTWGFAATVDMTTEAAVRAADEHLTAREDTRRLSQLRDAKVVRVTIYAERANALADLDLKE